MALVEAGIPVEVVPGVTTASATAAATGIPLTHRRLARSVRFITGHLALEQTETDWQPLALGQETLVIYMGFSHLEAIAARLMAAGLSPTTPLVLVQNATTSRQRVVHGEIGRSLQATEQLRLAEGPVLIMVGETTRLATQLDPSLAAQPVTAAADPLFWLDSA